MFKNVILLLSLISCLCVNAQPPKAPLCTKGQCGRERNACTCYCSVKCGPREIKPEDTPKWDEEDGQCFCAPRDKALYKVNECDIKEGSRIE